MGKVIGIDLGTTFSAVSVMEGGKPKIIADSEGNRTMPSVVSINGEEILVGEVAKRGAVANPTSTIRSIKRAMGTKKLTKIGDKEYSPEQISAMILSKLKKDAENYLGQEVTDAVITVPAYFGDAQRNATKDAGVLAGLNVKRIINEPTAASLAYGLDKEDNQTILVFDFGGGTFDVSILVLGGGVFEVKSTSGDNYLGGDDIDEIIINYLNSEFQKVNDVDLKKDLVALQRLRDAAEVAKIELSTLEETKITIPYIYTHNNSPKHLDVTLTRKHFEHICQPIFQRLSTPTKQAIKDAKLSKIDKVIFVGGSTSNPKVQELVQEITGLVPDKSVNPDEAVSLGAAIQGGILSGEVKDILLLDITPLTLGIEVAGGLRSSLIERNTTIPTRKSQVFTTTMDTQESVTINVLQGEREMAEDNHSLGRFDLQGIPPAPRGIPQIEVTFDIDTNGIVKVSAKDLGTGIEQKITVTGGALTEEEIEKMVRDSERYREDDRRKRESIEVRLEAEQTIDAIEKILHLYKDKLDTNTISTVKEEIEELKILIVGTDTRAIKHKLDDLHEASQEIGMKIYQKTAAEATQSGSHKPHKTITLD